MTAAVILQESNKISSCRQVFEISDKSPYLPNFLNRALNFTNRPAEIGITLPEKKMIEIYVCLNCYSF